MMGREDHLVELVSADGEPLGAATVDEAHRPPGRLHRAFSVVLFDERMRVLLQQRAAVKTRFPSRWANACCGHPLPGEAPAVAAGRRLAEELGPVYAPLTEVGVYTYRADDPATGRIEHEYDHVLVGHVRSGVPLAPNAEEVAAVRWVARDELAADLMTRPGAYAPWLAGVLDLLPTGVE